MGRLKRKERPKSRNRVAMQSLLTKLIHLHHDASRSGARRLAALAGPVRFFSVVVNELGLDWMAGDTNSVAPSSPCSNVSRLG